MKTLFLTLLLAFTAVPLSFADFASNVSILEKTEISKLTDEGLMDTFEDVLVELEAIRTFHNTSGFSPKQYDEFRRLLKYRLQLLFEIHSRNLEIPQQMER